MLKRAYTVFVFVFAFGVSAVALLAHYSDLKDLTPPTPAFWLVILASLTPGALLILFHYHSKRTNALAIVFCAAYLLAHSTVLAIVWVPFVFIALAGLLSIVGLFVPITAPKDATNAS